jgi:1,4-dihydroxy-2-naphthoyl-CoA hydrolase
MSDDAFEYVFRVRLHDIDAAGIMFFAHLFRHAHDAYEAFMATIGFPLDRVIRDAKWRLPLVHAEADYRCPLRHGDEATVRLRPAKVGERSFVLDYRFIDRAGEVCASARTVHVQSGPDGSVSAPLTDDLRMALTARLVDHTTEESGR